MQRTREWPIVPHVQHCAIHLTVLYEDNHLLAADKPAGMLTQASGGDGRSLEELAREYVKRSRGKAGNVFVHAAHRLDREVSGIVLFALTSKALARLNEQQRGHRWEKVYRAWVEGGPADTEGSLVHRLRHGSHRAEVAAGDADAKECRLTYEIIRREKGRSLLAVRLETGRYHQIRAQLAAAGWPILGDRKYGSRTPWPAGGIALRHVSLTLEHPVRRERWAVRADDAQFR